MTNNNHNYSATAVAMNQATCDHAIAAPLQHLETSLLESVLFLKKTPFGTNGSDIMTRH